ncbi:MAG: tetratricopeptide repeat protein [bacterium]|nr:tetratricopeptide repeat protein [bacterium]
MNMILNFFIQSTPLSLAVMLFLLISSSPASAREDVPLLYETSFALETQGKYAAALKNVLKIVRENPEEYTAVLRAGWLCYLNKNYSASVEYYEKAGDLFPDSIEPVLGIYYPLLASKKFDDAEDAMRKVIAIDAKNYTAGSRLAYLLFLQGRYGDAKKHYERMLALFPGNLEMKLGLGWTFVRMGNKKKAVELFSEVLRVSRSNANGKAGLAAAGKM